MLYVYDLDKKNRDEVSESEVSVQDSDLLVNALAGLRLSLSVFSTCLLIL